MPIDDRTTGRAYQMPSIGNWLADDVARVRAALAAIDADIMARYTKAEVDTLVNGLVNGAPGALNTLQELAAALGGDANFSATVLAQLALKANVAEVYTRAEADARYVQGQTQAEMVFVATANQTAFNLSTPVINKPSALVSIAGVIQPTSEYSLNQAGTVLTLTEGVPLGTVVRVLVLGVAGTDAPGDDTITTPKLRDAAVTPAKLAQPLTLTTAKVASGTAVDFTGMPLWVQRVTITLAGVGLAAFNSEQNSIAIRIGPAAGVEASGYAQSTFAYGANAATSIGFGRSDCFHVGAWVNSSGSIHGAIQLVKVNGNTWVASGSFNHSQGFSVFTAGSKTIANVLDTIRVTTVGGSDTFNAGTINILYE